MATNRIIVAAHFARLAHLDQSRKWTGARYITHPARVAARVTWAYGLAAFDIERMICAAWLHDVLEDTPTEISDIISLVGADVAQLVDELTNKSKATGLPRYDRKRLDRERISGISREAKIIKLIDRIDNLNEIPAEAGEFRTIYCNESQLLLNTLEGTHKELEDELQNAIYIGLGFKAAP